jgi:hypothetical protein
MPRRLFTFLLAAVMLWNEAALAGPFPAVSGHSPNSSIEAAVFNDQALVDSMNLFLASFSRTQKVALFLLSAAALGAAGFHASGHSVAFADSWNMDMMAMIHRFFAHHSDAIAHIKKTGVTIGMAFGTGRNKTMSSVVPSTFQERPIHWLADTLETKFKEIQWIEGLTLQDLDAATENKVQRLFKDEMFEVIPEIERRMSDNGSSANRILEKAVDELTKNHSVELIMVTVPVGDANEIEKRYGLPGFTDNFQRRIHEELTKKGVPVGLMGGRLFLLGGNGTGIDSEWIQQHFAKLIDTSIQVIVEDPTYKTGMDDKKHRDFVQAVDHLRFYSSHAPIDLKKIMAMYDRLTPSIEQKLQQMKSLFEKENRQDLMAKTLLKVTDAERRRFLKENDTYLKDRRDFLSLSAMHWIKQLAAGDESARTEASHFAELLVEDIVGELNANLQTVEKTTDPRLRQMLDETIDQNSSVSKGTSQRIRMFDHVSQTALVHRLLDRSVMDKGHLLSLYYHQRHLGRAKTFPLLNNRTKRLPRLSHLVPNWKGDFSAIGRDVHALVMTFSELTSAPSPEKLARFKAAYRDYRAHMLEALVLSYRDPRFEPAYKLQWVDEAFEADRRDLLRKLRDYLLYSPPDTKPERQLRRAWVASLIEPGLLLTKRPIGDEVALIIVDDLGHYWFLFSELTKSNAFNAHYPPDSTDSKFHTILRGDLATAIGYRGQKNPWRLLRHWNPVIEEATAEYPDYQSSEQAKNTQLQNERMPSFYLNEIAKPLRPTHLMDREGHIYEWDPITHKARLTKRTKEKELTEFTTRLSAALAYKPEFVVPGEALPTFGELSALIGNQKDDPALSNAVVGADQISISVKLAGTDVPVLRLGSAGPVHRALLKLKSLLTPEQADLYFIGNKLRRNVTTVLVKPSEQSRSPLYRRDLLKIGDFVELHLKNFRSKTAVSALFFLVALLGSLLATPARSSAQTLSTLHLMRTPATVNTKVLHMSA